MGKRVEFGSVAADSIRSNQGKATFTVKSKRVSHVDQISIAYSCPSENPDEKARSKAKYVAPDGGLELPARVTIRLPNNSEDCYVSASVSALLQDRAGPMTLKLVTIERR